LNKTSLVQCEEQVQERAGFAFRRKRLAAAAGGKGLGLSWFELPPGKKAFPMHFHLANDEAVFILEGEGILRLGEEEHPLRAGDYVAFSPGPPGHQIVNRSDAPLRYLAISTMREPEVAVYPESKKVGVLARGHGIMSIHRQGDAVDYYEGEE
jgi:uncharacterized cupin superfamily protein